MIWQQKLENKGNDLWRIFLPTLQVNLIGKLIYIL